MSKNKHIDKICCIIMAISLVFTILFLNGEKLGFAVAESKLGYEFRLFDTDVVHTVDIVCDDWDSFIATCENEEYTLCSAVIDGEAFKNIAIRAKGNTSLSSVSQMDSNRYSFKIEFDHYDSAKTYYGLDKLSLNNIIQDNTYMKDYIVYELMRSFGVNAPLCSFVYITVNGNDWGLYLAVEGIEEGFLERNYGSDYGELYKPDSQSFGGGRGNGKGFDFSELDINFDEADGDFDFSFDDMPTAQGAVSFSDIGRFEGGGGFPGEIDIPGELDTGDFVGKDFLSMGSSDVKLQYIDDDPDSYSNIFDNAKTAVTKADKNRLISSLKQLSDGEDIESVVDVEQVMRYFVVHNFVVNDDSYTGSMVHNYYLYEKDGQLSMIPWDYNLAFGTFSGGSAESSINDAIDYGSVDDLPMLSWIFENEEYTEQYMALYSDFIASLVDSGYLEEKITSALELISDYVEKDPTKFCTYDEFLLGVEALLKFCDLRAQSVCSQLSGETVQVSADGLELSTMGTMNNSSIGGMVSKDPIQDESENMQRPTDDMGTSDSSAIPDAGNQIPGGDMQMPGGDMQMPGGDMQMPGGDMQMPGGDMQMPGGDIQMPDNSQFDNMQRRDDTVDASAISRPVSSTGATSSSAWITLALCAVALAAMVIFVVKLPRTKAIKKHLS